MSTEVRTVVLRSAAAGAPAIVDGVPAWFHEFRDRLCGGLLNIATQMQELGRLYLEAITRDASFRTWLSSTLPKVDKSIWRNLELVGRGVMDPRIAIGGVPHCNRLARLPLSEQQQALDGPLPLLTPGGDLLMVRLDSLTREQATQLFGADHIRSPADQKAWLMAQPAAQPAKRRGADAPEIELDLQARCLVVRGVRLSVSELEKALRKLKKP